MKHGKILAASLLFGGLILLGIGAAYMVSGGKTEGSSSSKNSCIGTWGASYVECIENKLGEIAKINPSEAIKEYEAMAKVDPQLKGSMCHSLFHVMGQEATKSSSDPWEVFLAGNSECNWGYVHGAVEGYLVGGIDKVIQGAAGLCTPREGLDLQDPYVSGVKGNCEHGTGHALLHANENPEEAESGCRKAFEDKAAVLACIDGMIMEYGNSETAKNGRYGDICLKIGDDAKATCYSSIPLTWFNQTGGDHLKVMQRCDESKNEELTYKCSWGAGNLFMVQTSFDFEFMKNLCMQVGGTLRKGCYFGASVAVSLGVHTGALDQTELEAFVTSSPDATWVDPIFEEIDKAVAGFGRGAL